MICKNCNSEVPEGESFCPVCGQKVESQMSEVPEEKGTEEAEDKAYFEFEAAGREADVKLPEKRKRKKTAGIVAAAVLVLLIGIGVTAHAQIANFIKRNFSSTAEYYQYVETKNRDAGTEVFSNRYKAYYNRLCADEWKENTTYKLELGQTLKTMLSMTGTDFSALNDAGLVVSRKRSGGVSQSRIRGCINGQDVITLDMYVDMANSEGYVQIPEISSKYIDFSESMKLLKNSNLGGGNVFLNGGLSYLPEPENMRNLLVTYSDIAIRSMDSVEKSSGELEAGEVKGNYTKFTVTCKGKELFAVLKDMMNNMKEDPNIKAMADKFGEGAYDSFSKSLQEEIDDLNSQEGEVTDEDLQMVMDVYVDGDGKIAGRVINLKSKDGETFKMTFIQPENGSEIGTELSFAFNGVTYVSVIGKGICNGGKISGEYKVSLDESINPSEENIVSTKDLVTIKVTDVDEDMLAQGYMNGSITLSSSGTTFSSYSLQFDSKGDKENENSSISVLCGGDKLATLTVLSDQKDVPEIKKPGEGDEFCDASDDDAMEAYNKEADPEKILAGIKEKCGVDLSAYIKLIESFIEQNTIDPYAEYDLKENDLEDFYTEDVDPEDYDQLSPL